jgi:hypothetical protein
MKRALTVAMAVVGLIVGVLLILTVIGILTPTDMRILPTAHY